MLVAYSASTKLRRVAGGVAGKDHQSVVDPGADKDVVAVGSDHHGRGPVEPVNAPDVVFLGLGGDEAEMVGRGIPTEDHQRVVDLPGRIDVPSVRAGGDAGCSDQSEYTENSVVVELCRGQTTTDRISIKHR